MAFSLAFSFFIVPVVLQACLTVVAFVGFWFVTQPALIVVFARCDSILVDVAVATASGLKVDTASDFLSRFVGFGVREARVFYAVVRSVLISRSMAMWTGMISVLSRFLTFLITTPSATAGTSYRTL